MTDIAKITRLCISADKVY